MFDKRLLRELDKALIVAVFLIAVIGIITIYSATHARGSTPYESYVFRQMNWLLIGGLLLIVMIQISYQRFIDMVYLLYSFNVILLALVLVMGNARLGAQRWFSLGSFAFQPSEFIKLSLILALSSYIGSKKEEMEHAGSLVVPLLLLFIPFILVLMQPDLGTALMLIPITLVMLFVGGVRIKYLLTLTALGLLSLPVFWHFLRDYQKQRLLVFIDPNIDPLGAGYTIIQSKIAIGSGGLFGKGWLSGTQNKLNFLPERHTDFIFSVIGEEWGLFGAMALALLYIFIVKRALNIAFLTNDMYGRLVATGVALLISFQVIINIGMTIGLMPVVGIPLPLVSYGGSSMLSTFIAVGLLLSVGMRRSKF
ncbi:MAG: rod shape-determining protein RodA [Candidatus Omnitrophica bacterium]|nr:rod shape-determining protein RodA [Candidatus Omnitrophota bacterium]